MNARNVSPAMRAAAATMFFFAFPATAASGLTDCKCGDLRAMRDRWCSARAARSEYERIERYLLAETAKSGNTRMYSLSDKKMINQDCVQEAINLAGDRGAKKATAVTHENFPTESLIKAECRIEVTRSDTSCLKQIVEAHEVYHSRECQVRTEMWQSVPLNFRHSIQAFLYGASATTFMTATGDTKYSLTSAQFASEEAASYTREIVTINAKWKELQKLCTGANDFLAELQDLDTVGPNLWNNIKPDNSGRRFYKMYDPSNDPCPNRTPPPKSVCTLR